MEHFDAVLTLFSPCHASQKHTVPALWHTLGGLWAVGPPTPPRPRSPSHPAEPPPTAGRGGSPRRAPPSRPAHAQRPCDAPRPRLPRRALNDRAAAPAAQRCGGAGPERGCRTAPRCPAPSLPPHTQGIAARPAIAQRRGRASRHRGLSVSCASGYQLPSPPFILFFPSPAWKRLPRGVWLQLTGGTPGSVG